MQCDKVCERTLVAASDSCAMNAGRQTLSHALYAGSRLPQFASPDLDNVACFRSVATSADLSLPGALARSGN